MSRMRKPLPPSVFAKTPPPNPPWRLLRCSSSVRAEDYDAVFYPGGHGPLWDLAEDPNSIALIEALHQAGKPVAAVCHAPGVFRHVKDANGQPLVKGKRVTGFTNTEEDAVQLTNVVPFLVEDMLKAKGGVFPKALIGRATWSRMACC